MDYKDAILKTCETADFMVDAYLSDLTQEELMIRPVPGTTIPPGKSAT